MWRGKTGQARYLLVLSAGLLSGCHLVLGLDEERVALEEDPTGSGASTNGSSSGGESAGAAGPGGASGGGTDAGSGGRPSGGMGGAASGGEGSGGHATGGAGTGGAVALECVTSSAQDAAVGNAWLHPALAFTESSWGLAWTDEVSVLFDSLDSGLSLRNSGAEFKPIPEEAGYSHGNVLVAPLLDDFVVAYARTNAGTLTPGVVRVDPVTGANLDQGNGATYTTTATGQVEGLAVRQGATLGQHRIATVTRTTWVASGPALVRFYNGNLVALGNDNLTSTRGAVVAHAQDTNTFSVFAVDDQTPANIVQYAYDSEFNKVTSTVTTLEDNTAVPGQGYALSAAGVDDGFVVAWVDARAEFRRIYLTSVDNQSVRPAGRSSAVWVNEDGALDANSPQVVFDGTSIVVSWLEGNNIRLRRYTKSLELLGDEVCVECGKQASGQPSLTVAETNLYGIAYFPEGGGEPFRVRQITCDGP